MSCEAGHCGSCVFTNRVGDGGAKIGNCNIDNDPEVKSTYSEKRFLDHGDQGTYKMAGICGKYQLNPAAL